jgi:nicotinic acid mononucleotide adenylyltransferase
LYSHLLENGFIRTIKNARPEYLSIRSKDVLRKIREGDESWREMVPAKVADIITKRHLFSR